MSLFLIFQPLRLIAGQVGVICDFYTVILLKSVGVRKLQVAILARSSREMSQTVRID